MKTDTNDRILAYIRSKNGISTKEIVSFSGHSPQSVFRHLKKMLQKGQIYKVGKPPKVRYYAYAKTMKNTSQLITKAANWATSGDSSLASSDELCQTRDVFQARTDRLIKDFKRTLQNENLVYLLVAMVGEIGNNSFDHNIGQWLGIPGIFFAVDEADHTIILADRGQGVFATLKRARPQIKNDAEALNVAFTEIISGRAPEQRGNGLKFVKKVVIENNLRLSFYSGNAIAQIDASGLSVTNGSTVIPGTLCVITF